MIPISLGEILEKKIKVEFLVDNFLLANEPTIIFGDGGIGKSYFSLYLSIALGAPYDFFISKNFRIKERKTSIFLQTENSESQIQNRIKDIFFPSDYMMDKIFFPSSNDDIFFNGSLSSSEFKSQVCDFIDLTEKIYKTKIDVLFFDPLISYLGCDENDSSSVRKNLDVLSSIMIEKKVTIICIHHTNKSNDYRGSTAIRDWARNMIHISKYNNSDNLLIKQTKSNNMIGFKDIVINKKSMFNFNGEY